MGMGMRTGIKNKPPPSSAGVLFSSLPKIPDRERCRPATLLNTDKRQLYQIWPSPDAKAQERHHSYRLQSMLISPRETHIPFEIFQNFNFSILNPMGRQPSTTVYSFDILILPLLTKDHLIRRSHYSQVLYVVAVAHIAFAKS